MAKRSRANTAQQLEENGSLEPRSLPVQERSKETVSRILETAAELVDEVGVVGFTTNLLAERADIRVRTIYRYFPSKLGVLNALMIHLNEESEERLKELSELGDPERDWRELVGTWIDDTVKWTRERPGARLHLGWSDSVPELLALHERLDDAWTHSMMDAMRARGVELPSKQLYAVCRIFNEALDSMTSLAAFCDRKSSEKIADEARRMLIRYLELYVD
jgi:AcrR family transcriptional regulator